MKKVLFVCLGNICRSAAAEGIFQKFIQEANLAQKISFDSAGTSAFHAGEKADPRMIEHAKKRNYDLTSLSRPFLSPDDFEAFDYILTMDNDNYKTILKMSPSEPFKKKVFKMSSFCKIHHVKEVPDPYLKGIEGFEWVLDILEDACRELTIKLQKEVS